MLVKSLSLALNFPARYSLFKHLFSTSGSSFKQKVLRIGAVGHAHEAWKDLSSQADVLQLPLITEKYHRKEFLNDLLNNPEFKDISIITRTLDTKRQLGQFDEELLSHLPSTVKAIVHNGAGYDQIDIKPFSQRNIQVSNVPNLVNDSTANTHIFLLLSAMRNFQIGHHKLINNKWAKVNGAPTANTPIGFDPEGLTVGILGNGGIGRAVRDRLIPFGFKKILYYNRNRLAPDLEKDSIYASFDELLKNSDIISVNLPLNSKTFHIINKETISKMKDNVIIINTARGPVIDEISLIEGLKNGKIYSCGLDVFENEPLNVNKELLSLPNVVSIPHMGTHTFQTMKKMEEFVVDNVKAFLKSGKLNALVPEQKDLKF
ncbi:D-mandelate dehydrogenase-like dehydrogenase ASCRUDRAFT_145005 [Ascoidea rubescens DSM 1968]|uniref:Glyoxylate reductase n=1 Tax=Ascoidea rubescens DSM 1968 TaxID=1344418 RepID=A0A1D2VH76_9ASCO|nr:hypothetical protein ASCRUDRAFT_145005 [Ascoidea rubescens DSM 1968]ODV60975.1 hypothetical protein ASCRUDRAFT_145005 [Ascoidea rubescens DSM 1968]